MVIRNIISSTIFKYYAQSLYFFVPVNQGKILLTKLPSFIYQVVVQVNQPSS